MPKSRMIYILIYVERGNFMIAKTIRSNMKKAQIQDKSVKSVDVSEDDNYIVENPKEIMVELPLVTKIELKEKLPFFKSITMKLAAIYN